MEESEPVVDSDEDPDYIQADEGESSDDSGDENDAALVECKLDLPNNTLIADKGLPKYVFGHLRKNEYG